MRKTIMLLSVFFTITLLLLLNDTCNIRKSIPNKEEIIEDFFNQADCMEIIECQKIKEEKSIKLGDKKIIYQIKYKNFKNKTCLAFLGERDEGRLEISLKLCDLVDI